MESICVFFSQIAKKMVAVLSGKTHFPLYTANIFFQNEEKNTDIVLYM